MTKKITLWTIQKYSFYEKLKRENQIHITHSHDLDHKESTAYEWMRNSMKTRIGKPPFEQCMPIWAWYQWQSETKKRPDLRSRGHIESGTHAVRIEVVKDLDDVLLSDFILWHSPYWFKDYIPYDKNDELKIERLTNDFNLQDTDFFDYPEQIKSLIQKSWDHIFDLDFPNLDYTDPIGQKSIQATFWSLNISEVVKVQEFIAR